MTYLYDEETDVETRVEVEYDFDEYDPGDRWCPPSGGNAEMCEDVYVLAEDGSRTGKVLAFSDLRTDEQERLTEEAQEEAQEDANEGRMLRKAMRRGGKWARLAREY
jgi:hypothetical protein